MNTREVGRLGEDAALNYLQRQGYILVTRNFYCPYGELDLVMKSGQQLVFVEVKARTGTRFGSPEEAVGRTKLRRLRQSIACYLQSESPRFSGLRLDLVAVDLEPGSYRPLAVRHYQDLG